ncbi:MAG: AtpZ/AtpI family protein [Bdellovibrionales bacterium]|nr:AtpZ/AtpI family protein [Bdellovibrionales bacterium]
MSKKRKKGYVFVGMGFELLSMVLAAVFLGRYLDKAIGIKGLATVTLVFMFMGVWFYRLIQLIKMYQKDED